MIESLFRAVNKLAKWRVLYASWQLGTRSKEDPESQAVRDHREVTILLRAEVSALVGVLVDKGVCTAEEWGAKLEEECGHLEKAFEKKWPGARASNEGMIFDVKLSAPWMTKFPP